MPYVPNGVFPWIIRIARIHESPIGTYHIQCEGSGALTLRDAIAGGRVTAAVYEARWHQPHVATVDLFCDTCKGYGVKRGCKRKPCPTCHGRGSLPIPVAFTGEG